MILKFPFRSTLCPLPVRTYFLNQCKIISIDYSDALALDGVIGKVDANDIPGENEIIVMWQKEHCDKVKVKR